MCSLIICLHSQYLPPFDIRMRGGFLGRLILESITVRLPKKPDLQRVMHRWPCDWLGLRAHQSQSRTISHTRTLAFSLAAPGMRSAHRCARTIAHLSSQSALQPISHVLAWPWRWLHATRVRKQARAHTHASPPYGVASTTMVLVLLISPCWWPE